MLDHCTQAESGIAQTHLANRLVSTQATLEVTEPSKSSSLANFCLCNCAAVQSCKYRKCTELDLAATPSIFMECKRAMDHCSRDLAVGPLLQFRYCQHDTVLSLLLSTRFVSNTSQTAFPALLSSSSLFITSSNRACHISSDLASVGRYTHDKGHHHFCH